MGPGARGTSPGPGVRTPVVAGPLGEDVGLTVGEGMAGRVVVGDPVGGGGAVSVVLLGGGLDLVGLSMAGTPSEGLVVAGAGGGRTQR